MKRTFASAVVAAALLAVSAASPAADALRPAVGKPLQEAQRDIQAKKYKEALAAVDAAEKVGDLTSYERFVVDQMRGSAASAAGDTATAAAAFERVLAAKRLPADEQLRITEALAGTYLRAKSYPKAAQWLEAYKDGGGTRQETLSLLPQAYYFAGDFKKAASEAQAQIAAAEKAGRTPDEDAVKLLASAQMKQGDSAGYTETMEILVRTHPKPEYWANLIQHVADAPGFSRNLDLDVYRLQRATGNLAQARDYMTMAEMAVQAGLPGEAKTIVDEGYAKRVLGTGPEAERHGRLRALVEKKAAEDKAAIAGTDAQAASAASGDPLVKTGLAYVTYGDSAKGLPMIEKGIAKGKLKAEAQSRLQLVYAYYAAGEKGKVPAAAKSVGGKDGSADLARLWALVVQQ